MRIAYRRPIATSLLLVGSMILLTGCGDEGAHLPAGMTGSSAAYASTGGSDFLGGDPGPSTAGVTSQIDDPVLAGYDGIDEIGELGTDDVYGRAINDWNETEGALNGLDTDINLDDDGFLPAGYGGYGGGYDDGYGYGNGIMTAAMSGVGYGGAGLMDAGFVDPGFEDPGFVDPGFEDPGFDMGMDPGFVDPGFDAGIADPSFVDAGFDPGIADVGFDPGFVDAGVGVADIGIDAGAGIEGMVF